MTAAQDDGLWVRSDRTPDGSYVLSLSLGADHAWTLTPDDAELYARACLAAAEWAAFDGAVLRLLTERLGIPVEVAGTILAKDLRPDRPPLPTPPGPVRFDPGVTAAGKPFLVLVLDGERHSQLDVEPARQHALAVLSVITVADLDAGLYRWLLTSGIGPGPAAAAIDDLGNWRQP